MILTVHPVFPTDTPPKYRYEARFDTESRITLYGVFDADKPRSFAFAYPVGDALHGVYPSDLQSAQTVAEDIFDGMRANADSSKPIGPATQEFVRTALRRMFALWQADKEGA